MLIIISKNLVLIISRFNSLNYTHYPKVFFKNEINSYLKPHYINQLANKLKKLLNIYS